MAIAGRRQPLKPSYTRGWIDYRVPFTTRTDDFNDGVIDTTLWANFNATTETGGQGVITCNTLFNGYRTLELFSIQENSVTVQITPSVAGGATTQVINEFLIGSSNTALVPAGTQIDYQIDVLNGQLKAMVQVGFADAGTVSTAYNATAMAWLRIRETGGQLFFDYSPTGAPSSWTNLRTTATPAWVGFASQRVSFQANRSDGTNDTMRIDSFNLPTSDPATPSPVWHPAPWRWPVPYPPKYSQGYVPAPATISPYAVLPIGRLRPFPLPPGAQISRTPDTRPAPSNRVGVGLDGSQPIPLSVRLTTNQGDGLFVSQIRDVSFRSVIPGGYASATVTLDRKPWLKFPEVDLYGRMYIYDTRSGETVWEGRVEDPGKSADDKGFPWTVTAIGPSAHAKDQSFPYIPIMSDVTSFEKFGGSLSSATVSASNDANDNDGVRVQFAGGITVPLGGYVSARDLKIQNAGLQLASVAATAAGGGTGQWTMNLYVYGPSSPNLVDSVALQTSPVDMRGVVGSDFTDGQYSVHLRMDRTGAAAAPDDNAWTMWTNVVLRTKLVDEEGNPATDYSDDFVTTGQMVADVVGKHLPMFDALDAFIQDTTYQHTQVSYDSVSAYDFFNDMMAIEGAYYWAAWETVPRSGKWRFEFRPWSTTVRYEASVDDGWTNPGSAADLYNQVRVTWKDSLGRDRQTLVTASVPILDNAGIIRTATLDLGQEIGTVATATKAGQSFLTEHNLPSQNGTLVIARPIIDYQRGMLVDPWQIRPGGLIRVRGVDAQRDALNPAGRDGSTVFRIMTTDFRSTDGSVQLSLDQDAYSTSKAIAQLQSRRTRR